MRHGNQFKSPVVDAKHLVDIEIQPFGVTLDLLVTGGKAKAQVAIMIVKPDQMAQNARPMIRTQGPNRNRYRLRLIQTACFFHVPDCKGFP